MQSSITTSPEIIYQKRRIDETKAYAPWVVCFVAAAYFFYEFIQMNMFNAISDDLMRSFNISGANLSSMSSAYFYADALLLFPAGLILDRVSTKKLILTGLGICFVSSFLFASAHELWFAIACHFAAGLGNAFCLLSCVLLASRWFPANRLAFVTGLMVTFAMAGGMVAQTPLELLTQHIGWRLALFLNGLLGALIWILNWLYVYDKPQDPARDHSRSHSQSSQQTVSFSTSIKSAFRNLQNIWAGLYTSTLNLPLMVLGGLWGSLFLQQVHHFSAVSATGISTLLFVGTIIGCPVFGSLSDNIRRRRLPMIWGAILSLLTMLAVGFVTNFSLTTAGILFFLLGFFTSSQIISYPLITEVNQKNITGTSLGLASTIIMGGAGIAQQIFGYIIDLFWDKSLINGVPHYSVTAYHAAMILFPVTLIVGLLCAFLTKETYCQNITETMK